MVSVKTSNVVKKESDTTFIGKVKLVEFDNGSFLFNLDLGDKDREKLNATKTATGWNNLVLQKSKEGNWYLSVSKFVPKKQ